MQVSGTRANFPFSESFKRLPGATPENPLQKPEQTKVSPSSPIEDNEKVGALAELRRRDQSVRNKIENLLSTLGVTIAATPSYEFTKGPDDRLYAKDGKISLNFNRFEAAVNPKDALRKIQNLQKAALAMGGQEIIGQFSQSFSNLLERAARRETTLEKIQNDEIKTKASRNYTPQGGRSPAVSGPMFFDQLF